MCIYLIKVRFNMDASPVIVDPGSCTIKAGFPGELPSQEVPSLIARDRQVEGRHDYGRKCGRYVGHDAVGVRGICQVRYPIEHGFVSEWDDYDILLRHVMFEDLRIIPDDHPLLIAENPRNPKGNTEKTVELAFENWDVPVLSIQNTSFLSLYAETLDTGLVIELGDGAFTISPIYDSSILRHCSPRVPWSGRNVTDFLRQQLLKEENAATADQRDSIKMRMFWDTLCDIKHKCCFVSKDYESDLLDSHAHAQSYEMPDGTDLQLSFERFVAPEALLKPDMLGMEMHSLPVQISDYLKRTDDDIRTKLLSNVVICGGSSLFAGLTERFKNELEILNSQDVHIVTSSNQKYLPWIGGSRFASDHPPTDSKYWLSKQEYDEHGPSKIVSKIIS